MVRCLWGLICCIVFAPVCSCVSLNSAGKDNLGHELKKKAIEDKAAIREMQYKNDKNRTPNYLGLARNLIDKGFYDIALGQLENAQKKEAKNSEIFFLKGVCLRKKEAYEKAITEFKKAVSVNPKYAYAYAGLGLACNAVGDHVRAEVNYKKAIQIDPGVPAFYNNLGMSYIITEELEKAIEYFKKCIALNPGFIRAINNLGIAYGIAGEDARALKIFKKMNDKAVAFNNMGYVCRMRGQKQKAIEMYRLAINENPDFVTARNNLQEIEKEVQNNNNPEK